MWEKDYNSKVNNIFLRLQLKLLDEYSSSLFGGKNCVVVGGVII